MHGSMYMCFGCASLCQRTARQLCQAEPCVSWPTSTGPSCPTQMKASHNRGFTSLSLSLFLSHSLSLSISLSSSGPVLCPGMHGPCTTEVNEYPALPRTVNAVAVTVFHAVRDARIVGMPVAADKRTAVTVHRKVMKSIGHRLPSTHNVVLHPGNNRTRHPCLVVFIHGICGICSRIRSR